MLIDTHVHVWALDDRHRPPAGAILKPPSQAAPVEWLVQDMEEFGIDHCVLVLASTFGWDNSYMLECLERYPGTFKAIGLVDPLDPGNAGTLRDLMRQGLSGFRFHPLYYREEPTWVDAAAHDPLWRAAADTNAILQYHMLPRHAPALHRMAVRHPDVRVIVDHLGKPDTTEAPPYPSFDPVLRLADLPNVWMKIGDYQIASKEAYPWRDTWPFVALLRERFGAERMIWGTGYPRTARLVPLDEALSYVRGLPCFTPEDLDLVLGETPRRLFDF
jgi:predicted TIM-barrel fold metal-dependent hydrolase